MTLADSFNLKRNAIAFLRPALSVMVILGHAWELGGFGPDPLKRVAGVALGVFAVHCFFIVGGFLVAGSFENSGSWRRYLANRALRIFPGFWVCLLVTAGLVLPLARWVTVQAGHAEPAASLAAHLRYVIANSLLRINQPTVGGIFSGNVSVGIVNGSLWSLFPEMLCYTFLAVAGVAGLIGGRRRWLLLSVGVAAWGIYAASPQVLAAVAGAAWEPKLWYLLQLNSLLAYFCGGALAWAFRSELPFSPAVRYAALALAAGVLACDAYRILGPLVLPFAMLALATLLPWHRFDRHGDVSYGLYLYHYPIMQTLCTGSFHFAAPVTIFGVTLAATLPMAWLSWVLVERPALSLKRKTLHAVPDANPPHRRS